MIHQHAICTPTPGPAVSGVQEDKGQTLRDQGHGWPPTQTTQAKGLDAGSEGPSAYGAVSLQPFLLLLPPFLFQLPPKVHLSPAGTLGTSYH